MDLWDESVRLHSQSHKPKRFMAFSFVCSVSNFSFRRIVSNFRHSWFWPSRSWPLRQHPVDATAVPSRSPVTSPRTRASWLGQNPRPLWPSRPSPPRRCRDRNACRRLSGPAGWLPGTKRDIAQSTTGENMATVSDPGMPSFGFGAWRQAFLGPAAPTRPDKAEAMPRGVSRRASQRFPAWNTPQSNLFLQIC